MSYNDAKRVRDNISEMLRWNKDVLIVGIENNAGNFDVVVGAMHPDDVEVPNELDGVVIRVIKAQPPSPYEPSD